MLFSVAHCFHPADDAAVLCGMGQAVIGLGFHEVAAMLLSKSLELNADDHVTLLHLGIAYHETGRLEHSCKMLEKAVNFSAKAGDHYHLKECLRQMKLSVI